MNFEFEHNNEIFECKVESSQLDNLHIHDFEIKLSGEMDNYEIFEFQVTCIIGGINIVTEMHNNDYPSVSGKGIAAYMIEYANCYVGGKLYSSTNCKAYSMIEKEFRSDSAERVWARLVSEGKALYLSKEDRYFFIM